MAITLLTWDTGEIIPMMDAIIQDVGVGESGILYGCTVSAIGNALNVSAGYGLIKGRLFQVESTDISVTLAPDSNLVGRLYIKLDLSNSETPISIEVATGNELYTLTQEDDANYTDGTYEISLATFTVSTSEITDIVNDRNMLLYNSGTYYKPGDTVRLAVSGGGTLTAGKTAVLFGLPLNKSTEKVHGASLASGSSLTIRQDGNYLMGSGSGGAAITSAYTTSFDVMSNCIRMTLVKSSGFGGTNNGSIAVVGSVVVTFN